MNIQTIVTETGEELVVMSRRDYDALLARAGDEDAEDRMTTLIAAEGRAEQPLPESVSAAVLNGSNLLKALRRWRGLTQEQLATASGINQGYLSEIESGSKTGSDDTLLKLDTALGAQGWLSGNRAQKKAQL